MYLNTVNQWKVLLKLPDLYRLCYKNKIKLRQKLIYYRISFNVLYWWCATMSTGAMEKKFIQCVVEFRT